MSRKTSLEPIHTRPSQGQQPFLVSHDYSTDASDADYPERMSGAVAQQRWAMAMSETVHVSGCTCVFCVMRSETNDVAEPIYDTSRPHSRGHARRSLPSFPSIMEVLYPPSCPGTAFPDPPSYSLAYPAQEDHPETSSLIYSTAASVEGVPLSHNRLSPLAQGPSLTGVPFQEISPRRGPVVEPNPPIFGLDGDIPDEPPPAYLRFDQRRPCFHARYDILGPYPSMSILRRSAR